jgi:hypothetical protein
MSWKTMLSGMWLILVCLWLAACNAPPLYESKARDFLRAHGVAAATIAKLEERVPLSSAEVETLTRFEHVLDVPMVGRVLQYFSSSGRIATLHLLASNPAASRKLLERLIAHPVEDVRWGAATNPNTPQALLFAQRSVGSYSTMNAYLARNPALPVEVLWQMYHAHEAAGYDFALNPACPLELMQEILLHGNETDRTWLAWNKNLPDGIRRQLEQDPSPDVQRMLRAHPAR